MGQLSQKTAQITLQAILFHLIAWQIAIAGEQLQQFGVITITHLHFKADGLTSTAHQIFDVVFRQLNELSQLGHRGGASQLLAQLPLTLLELVQHLRDVNGQPNRAALLSNGPRDALADPPIGVGGKLVAPSGVELLNTTHQSNGSLLNQVQELHVPLGVLLGHAHHQSEVGGHHPLLGAATMLQLALELHRGQT